VAAAIVVSVALWPTNGRQPNRPAPKNVGSNRTSSNLAAVTPPGKQEVAALPGFVVEQSPVQVEEIDGAGELDRLRHEIVRSETEIRRLAEQAKLRRASAQLELLLAKYGRD
jgi:hypothetical protein